MKNRPACIEPLLSTVQSFGLTKEELHVPETRALNLQAQAAASRKTKQIADAATNKEVAAHLLQSHGAGVAEFVEALPDSKRVLSDLGLMQIRDRLLPAIEDTSLSGPNLRTMQDPLHRNNVGMMKHTEVCTSWPLDAEFVGSRRCFYQLMQGAMESSEVRGRLAMEMHRS